MQPNRLQASELPPPLLTYSLTTEPMPVQISPSTTSPSVATLIFVVSCPQPGATVAAIEIILPVDPAVDPPAPAPTNLCMTAPLPSDASISSSGKDVWIPSEGPAPGIFLFEPQDETVLVAGQSLTIELTNIQINTLVGTAQVVINEWAAPGTDAPPTPEDGDPPSGQQFVAVAKFPYGFYAGNFTSNKPMVKNGEIPVLSWMVSSNATCLMLYESNSVDVSKVQTWSPPEGLTQMTTFILQVSAQQEQGDQTATMDFSITIEVADPSLAAQDLTVLTTSTLQGAVNVGSSATPANLVVNGDVQGKNLTAQGAANVAGALNVTGAATLSNILNVAGAATLSNILNVAGAAKLTGGLTANAPVSLFGSMVKYGAGTYTAPTDGLVIGYIWSPPYPPYYFNATITGSSGGISVAATGGGWISCVNPPNYYGAPMSGSFVLPVRKGNTWSVQLSPPWTTSVPWPTSYAFFWLPLGTSTTALAATLEDSSLVELMPAPVEPPDEMMLNLSAHPTVLMPETSLTTSTASKKPTARKKPANKKKPAAAKKTKRR